MGGQAALSWALWSPGKLCPFRHDHGEQTVVCKHWLRGLCKKGDQCKFLHQYDLTRMPECYFFSKFGNAPSWPQPFPGRVVAMAVGPDVGEGRPKEAFDVSGGRPGLPEPRRPASPMP